MAEPDPADGRGTGRGPWPALVPLLLGTFTGTVANTIVNVPLTLILRDLDASISAGTLVVVGFTLPFAVLLPLSGWLGDRCGPRRVFLAAMLLLGIGSAGAGLAGDLASLVAMRAVQGVATAAMLPAVMALIASLFGGGRRGRALGLWAAANGVGQAARAPRGGRRAPGFGWDAGFWPGVPRCAPAPALARRLVP
ncbi:MFS transporter, partial [Actinomadura sp. NPDC000929]|uniref:MFS transporter n=1 Tax=Actinomadura sp. NPDC000929 TaxID=3154517 RepID=UPI003398C267